MNTSDTTGACGHENTISLTADIDSSNVNNDQNEVNANKDCSFVTVWTLVSLDSCLRASLNADDLKAVESIFKRFDHLKKNIVELKIGTYSTRSGNGVYCHDLHVKVIVDTGGLWDGARKYIWKFMGQDEWTLSDGTIVSVNRIHTK